MCLFTTLLAGETGNGGTIYSLLNLPPHDLLPAIRLHLPKQSHQLGTMGLWGTFQIQTIIITQELPPDSTALEGAHTLQREEIQDDSFTSCCCMETSKPFHPLWVKGEPFTCSSVLWVDSRNATSSLPLA